MSHEAQRSGQYERTMLAIPESIGAARRAPEVDPLLGVELAGTYRVEHVLGEGGMGKLYQARHLRLDRPFAVKVIHHPLSAREDLRVRFEREARVMSRVRSDHVVDIIDVAVAPDGRTCIISELLTGHDLEEHLVCAGGKLKQVEAVSLMRQCLRGLSAAHAQGVVHRDLKPSNLYVAADGTGRSTLKILDFGVAKSSNDSELTSTGVIVGTPAYMAPEQARGAIYADQRSDVYAAGAVLYRMITGRSPYSETDAGGTLMRLMEGAPPRPSLIEREISPGLEAVIEQAMARDPAQRFQSVEELDAALAPFDGGASSTLTSAVSTKQLDRHARLTRPLAVLLTVSLALACGLSTAAVLSLFVQGLSRRAQLNTTELVLVILGASVATIATGMTSGKALADAWRNVAAVQARTRKMLNAVCVGLMALGALELASQLWLVFVVQAKVTATPFWVAGRVLVALLAASLVTLRGGSQRLVKA